MSVFIDSYQRFGTLIAVLPMNRRSTKILSIMYIVSIVAALFLAGGASNASAQTGITASVFIDPFPSPYLSDWESNPSIGSISATNDSGVTLQVRFFATITESRRGVLLTANSGLFFFPPGSFQDIATPDMVDYKTVDYSSSIKDIAVRTGRLPEGEYTICLELRDQNDIVLLTDICATFTIVFPDPPYLIFPNDADTVVDLFPTFQWTPVQAPVGFPVHYTFRLAEVFEGQAPSHALNANVPLHEEPALFGVSLQYPLYALPLIKDKLYVWQIQALDDNGYPPTSNNGKSEFWTFIYDADTTTPPEPASLSGIIRDSASGNPLGNAIVRYREIEMEVSGSDTTWSRAPEPTVVRSSGTGVFTFSDLKDESYYELIISAFAHDTRKFVGSKYFLAGNMRGGEFRLLLSPPGYQLLAGVVRDLLTDEPVPNVALTYQARKLRVNTRSNRFGISSITRKWVTIGPSLHTVANDKGEFTFTNARNSTYFGLSVPGSETHFATTPKQSQAYQEGDIDNFILLLKPKSAAITGTLMTNVLGGSQVPVEGAIVELSISTDVTVRTTSEIVIFGRKFSRGSTDEVIRVDGASIRSVYSKADGQFRFDNVSTTVDVDIDLSSTSSGIRRTRQEIVSVSQPALRLTVNDRRFLTYLSDELSVSAGTLTETGEHTLDAKTATIAGIVRSEDAPVEGARVALYSWIPKLGSVDSSSANDTTATPVDSGAWGGQTDAIYGEPLDVAVSGPDGSFTMPNIPINDSEQEAEHYVLRVTSDYHHGAMAEARISEHGQRKQVNFELRPRGGFVHGIISGQDGSGTPMAKVALWKWQISPFGGGDTMMYPVEVAETGGDGAYGFDEVTPGTYWITAMTPSKRLILGPEFVVINGQRITVSLLEPKGKGYISGIIKSSNGDTLRNAYVKSDDLPIFVTTDNSGKFLLSDMPLGELSLFFSSFHHQDDTISVMVRNADTTEVEITLQKFTGRYRVRVVDKSTGKALPSMTVTLAKNPSKTTDFNGRVVFDGVDIGHQELKVTVPKSETFDKDFVPFSTTVSVKRSVGTSELVVEMVPGARLSGTVKSKDSAKAIAAVVITVEGTKGITAKTDKRGKFVLKNIPVGTPLTLVAIKAGYKVGRLNKNWSVKAGDHIQNVSITLESSPLDSLFGFPIVLDSLWTVGSKKYVTGAITNIKSTFGLAPSDSTAQIRFEKVELDSNLKPTKSKIRLASNELEVNLFNFSGVLSDSSGLELEWLDSLGVGRLGGAITLWDQTTMLFPETFMSDMTIPQTKAPSFWSDGVNRGLQRFGITATDTEVRAKLKGVTLAIDYTKTTIDTAGFHFYGSLMFGEKFKLGMENLLIGNDENDDLRLKAITILTEPAVKIPLYAFTVYDSSTTWNNTGIWVNGSIEMTRLGGREFGLKDLHVSSKGDFLSATVTAEGDNARVELYGQSFDIEEITFGTDNWDIDTVANKQYFAFTGKLNMAALDKPITFQNLKYTEDDEVYGVIGFNQTMTMKSVFALSLEELVFDTSEAGDKFVGITGGVRLGAIKGLNAQVGNLRFYRNSKVTVDEIGFGFFAGPTEAQFRIRWSDTLFEGEGLLNVRPAFSAGAEFRYGGSTNWWIKVTSGTRIPLGGVAMLVNASGGVGRNGDTWRFSLGGTFAPATSEKSVALDILVDVYRTPEGIIIYGEGDASVGGGALALGHAWFKLDLPKSRFDGAITMEYSKGPLVINGQIDIGAKFGKYWFVHGRANANFLQFFTANGLIVFAENWDFFYRGESRRINGYIVDLQRNVSFDGQWGNIGWGVALGQHGYLMGGWDGTVEGGVGVNASAYGYVDFNVFGELRASGGFSLTANLANDSYGFRASGTADARLEAKVGGCNANCWSVCSYCSKKKWGICYWGGIGGKVCLNLKAQVKYSSNSGTSVSASF